MRLSRQLDGPKEVNGRQFRPEPVVEYLRSNQNRNASAAPTNRTLMSPSTNVRLSGQAPSFPER